MNASLLDFGIAKFKKPLRDTTGRFVLQGTPLYLSPEICRGGSASPLSDLYAVGTVLHTLFLGTHFILRNHPNADYEDILRAHITQVPEPLCELIPGFPPQLSNIVARAMAKDPADRWPSALEMGEELARYELEFSEECHAHRLTPTMRDLVALTRAKSSTPLRAVSVLERTTLRRLPDSIPNGKAALQTQSLLDAFVKRALHPSAQPSHHSRAAPSDSGSTPAQGPLTRATIPQAPDARRRAGLSRQPDLTSTHTRTASSGKVLPAPPAASRTAATVLSQNPTTIRTERPIATRNAGVLDRLDAAPLRQFIQWAVVLAIVVSLPLGVLVGRSSAAKLSHAGLVTLPRTTEVSVPKPASTQLAAAIEPARAQPATLQPIVNAKAAPIPAPKSLPAKASALHAKAPTPVVTSATKRVQPSLQLLACAEPPSIEA